MKKIKIYHGAPMSALSSILEHGIVPRSQEHPGSWRDEPSTVGFVYLTVAHAIWYATAPTMEDQAVILELYLSDVPVSRRHPDEDYLEQETWRGGEHENDPDWSLDIQVQKGLWRDSLNKMGNIAVKGAIPPTAIRQYAILKNDDTLWSRWINRRIDRRIEHYQAQKSELQATLSFIFDRAPLLQKWSRMKFDAFCSHRELEDHEFLWETIHAVQVGERPLIPDHSPQREKNGLSDHSLAAQF